VEPNLLKSKLNIIFSSFNRFIENLNFFLTTKNKMNKKEHLRGAPTLLQNEKSRKDYKAIPF